MPRISKETGLSEDELNKLIDDQMKTRQIGIFGELRVNVTDLNIELLKK